MREARLTQLFPRGALRSGALAPSCSLAAEPENTEGEWRPGHLGTKECPWLVLGLSHFVLFSGKQLEKKPILTFLEADLNKQTEPDNFQCKEKLRAKSGRRFSLGRGGDALPARASRHPVLLLPRPHFCSRRGSRGTHVERGGDGVFSWDPLPRAGGFGRAQGLWGQGLHLEMGSGSPDGSRVSV